MTVAHRGDCEGSVLSESKEIFDFGFLISDCGDEESRFEIHQ
jgi:hypothetical protein